VTNERLNHVVEDAYVAPALSDYGTIEAWTQGARAQLVEISIVIG
jgi:hypothetical protein